MWNIRRVVKKGDYLYAVVPEHPKAIRFGYVLYHRVLMENSIGRMLLDNEIVHHIDENKHNNNISNLEVMDRSDHTRHHTKTGRNIVMLVCANCGVSFEREKRLVKGKGLCSRRCNGQWNQKNSSWIGKKKV